MVVGAGWAATVSAGRLRGPVQADSDLACPSSRQITFVACVRNLSKSATNVGYLVEDGTGS